jgi:hypothetical protein
MKRICLLFIAIFALSCLLYLPLREKAAEAAKLQKVSESAKPQKKSCTACHTDFTPVLPKEHLEVKGGNITACLDCHPSETTDEAKPNPFSSRIHRAHFGPKENLDCTVCHTWIPGKTFALIGQKQSIGAPSRSDMTVLKNISSSWSDSPYLDSLHGRKNVTCRSCHGKRLPESEDTVDNERCLKCHGPLEKLVAQTAPKDFPDRNPHKSHLGEIGCAVCHHGHGASSVYCLNCHGNFKMKIPGQGQS